MIVLISVTAVDVLTPVVNTAENKQCENDGLRGEEGDRVVSVPVVVANVTNVFTTVRT